MILYRMKNDDQLSDEDQFPREDVEAARKNHSLQRQHPVSIARQRYGLKARPRPQCGSSPENLIWFSMVEFKQVSSARR
jgi:hypothetical protein